MRKDIFVSVIGSIVATIVAAPVSNALSDGKVINWLGGYTQTQVEDKISNLALIQSGPRLISIQQCVDLTKQILSETSHTDIHQRDGNYIIGRFEGAEGDVGYVGVDCHSVSNEWGNIFIASSGAKNEVSRVRQINQKLQQQTKPAELILKR